MHHVNNRHPEALDKIFDNLPVSTNSQVITGVINSFGKDLDKLDPLIALYNPEKVIREFVEKDSKGLLYDFLYKRVNGNLKVKLNECRNYNSTNVAYLSASIRHIFAHGYLCAHSNRINPKNVYSICTSISDFLLNFMDAEFTKKIEEYYSKVHTEKGVNLEAV